MARVRPELLKGLAALLCLLLVVVVTETITPDPFQLTQYTQINPNRIRENPAHYEGMQVSLSVWVNSTQDYDTEHVLVNTVEDIPLLYPTDLDSVDQGDRLLLRGVSRVESLGYIEVVDAYILDTTSSPIRSIPGIILFVMFLFYVYRLDVRRLVFLPRRDSDA